MFCMSTASDYAWLLMHAHVIRLLVYILMDCMCVCVCLRLGNHHQCELWDCVHTFTLTVWECVFVMPLVGAFLAWYFTHFILHRHMPIMCDAVRRCISQWSHGSQWPSIALRTPHAAVSRMHQLY